MSDPQRLVEAIVQAWMVMGFCLFFYGWINWLVLGLYAGHRWSELRDPRPDWRPTLPTHAGLQYYCCFMYGLLFPGLYFLTVRTRNALGPWLLGGATNSPWTIALGVACMAWLAVHLIEAALRGGRVRFAPTWPNRAVGAAAVGLCLWLHASTLAAAWMPRPETWLRNAIFWQHWIVRIVYLQVVFLGATLVYGSALAEAWLGRNAAAGEGEPGAIRHFTSVGRRRRWAGGTAAAGLVLLFAPCWLSIPRTTPRQAMALLETNREAILQTAQMARLDPALLAGIIYVAHTRDRPRWTGDFIELAGLRMESSFGVIQNLGSTLLNPSTGLCQMRLSTVGQTCLLIGFQGFNSPVSSSGGDPGQTIEPGSPGVVFEKEVEKRNNAIQAQNNQNAQERQAIRNACAGLSMTIDSLLLHDSFHADLPKEWLDYYKNYSYFEFSREASYSRKTINLAAAMLMLLREQWRQEGYPIDGQPEILATLYNLGYERSRPHGAPQANDFGRRVKAFMDSEACRALFPPPAPEGGS